MARTQYATTSKYGMPIFDGSSTEDPGSLVPEGYSLDKAYQDQKPADYLHTRTTRGAGKDGRQTRTGKAAYYKIEKPAGPAPEAPQLDKAPEPLKEEPKAPVTPSDTLQNAMNTVRGNKSRDVSFGTGDRDAERRALTDSFSQKSYDPEAGIASKEAGDFLDNYKLNLGKKFNLNTEEAN